MRRCTQLYALQGSSADLQSHMSMHAFLSHMLFTLTSQLCTYDSSVLGFAQASPPYLELLRQEGMVSIRLVSMFAPFLDH